jgi:urease accessory protein
MDALLLLLLDSRAPAGAHAHSGGMEPAVTAGLVADLGDVEEYCRGRLRTAGRVSAAFAATACAASADWDTLDAEYDARLPSEALRQASRQLGGGLRRMLRAMFPEAVLPWPYAPHHPIALGHGVALAGGTPDQAAQAAALATITAPASAAVRLLGLDPLAVQGMLARLAADLGDFCGGGPHNSAKSLPADGAPFLDLLADIHRHAEVRLFAS